MLNTFYQRRKSKEDFDAEAHSLAEDGWQLIIPQTSPLTQCSVFSENSNCDSNRKQNGKEDGGGVNTFTTFQVNSSNSQGLGMTATRNLGSLRMACYKYWLFSVNVLVVRIQHFHLPQSTGPFLKLPQMMPPRGWPSLLQVPDGEAERLSELLQATHFISRPQVPIWDYLCKFLTLCTTNKCSQGKTQHMASAVCIVWETLLSGAGLLGCHVYLLGYPAGVHLQLPLITRVDIIFIQQQEQKDHSKNKCWVGPRSSRPLARLRHIISKHIGS